MLQLAPSGHTLPDPPLAPAGAPPLADALGARLAQGQHLEAVARRIPARAPGLCDVDLDQTFRQQVADGAARSERVAVEAFALDVAVGHDTEVPE